MSAKLNSSKLMSVMMVLAAIAIGVSYLAMSDIKTDNMVYYTELAVYALAGIIFSLGIRFACTGRKTAAILVGCVSLFLPIFIIPCLTVGSKSVPYLFLVSLYAKRTMTVTCPFLSVGLLKWLRSMMERRRHGAVLVSFSYFAFTFAVIALLQGAVKWQYSYWYGIDTTWNAVETFYWAVTINAVYIWRVLRNTTDVRGESSGGNVGKHILVYAVIADVAAAIAVVCKSRHIRKILQDFVVKLTESDPVYALRDSTWLSYRVEIFKGIINGEYSVGENMFLENFPDEFPVRVLWTSEPLVSIRLTYGWPITMAQLVLLAVLIVLLHVIECGEQPDDEIGVWIRYSFTALTCLSFISQMFVPAYGLIMPLMGDGVCMIALLVVYIALPKLRTADIGCVEKQ